MKLTCVTAVFNAIKSGNGENLVRCIRSVASLKTQHEHLVYDGGSTDGTVEILKKLRDEDNIAGLRFVSEPDTGIYNALNKGVRDAKGEWFYVLGCDDYIGKPKVMDDLIAKADSTVDVIATPVKVDGIKGNYVIFADFKKLKNLFFTAVCCHQGEIARTRLVRLLGGFDERYRISADTNMFLLARLRNAKFNYEMRDFAVFTMGGTASSNEDCYKREDAELVARALNLTEAQMERLKTRRVLPIPLTVKLMFHRNFVVRMAARTVIWMYLRPIVRFFSCPLIVATRPLRLRLLKAKQA